MRLDHAAPASPWPRAPSCWRFRPRAARAFPTSRSASSCRRQAGGMADILSRVFAQKVKENSGATVIVENKTGANGVLAADDVAKSAPNGLTVLIGFQGTNAVLPHLDAKLPYKPLTDFAPGGAGRLGALRAGGASVVSGEDRQGVRRDREAEAGRLQLRVGGLRHHASSRGRAVQDRGRRRISSASPIAARRPPTRT